MLKGTNQNLNTHRNNVVGDIDQTLPVPPDHVKQNETKDIRKQPNENGKKSSY